MRKPAAAKIRLRPSLNRTLGPTRTAPFSGLPRGPRSAVALADLRRIDARAARRSCPAPCSRSSRRDSLLLRGAGETVLFFVRSFFTLYSCLLHAAQVRTDPFSSLLTS